jgi:hypothetical protein
MAVGASGDFQQKQGLQVSNAKGTVT